MAIGASMISSPITVKMSRAIATCRSNENVSAKDTITRSITNRDKYVNCAASDAYANIDISIIKLGRSRDPLIFMMGVLIRVRQHIYTETGPWLSASTTHQQPINSSPLSAAYMHQWNGSALVQIMACRLFDIKPLSKHILGYCQLDP